MWTELMRRSIGLQNLDRTYEKICRSTKINVDRTFEMIRRSTKCGILNCRSSKHGQNF